VTGAAGKAQPSGLAAAPNPGKVYCETWIQIRPVILTALPPVWAGAVPGVVVRVSFPGTAP